MYLRKQRIAEEAGFTSRRTAIRACNRLEKLGIIKQHKARRASGDKRQTANIIIIQPVQRATLQEEPSDKQLSKTADTYNNLSNPCQRKSQKYFDESHQPDTRKVTGINLYIIIIKKRGIHIKRRIGE